MQAAKKETVFEFPDGGIADFYMTDDQFAELERRETVGHGGIANVHNIADRIAEYGRYGDDTLAHVETGELVVPKALLEKNPALKASIFEHLEELGVEDPERYIVGSGVNSLNPDTQLPEFFVGKLFKKARKVFKKVVKGVKKTLKKVGKVLKKASAVVLPVVLTLAFPAMGSIMTGALSGGIGTLINGGNLKDALKAAAIGGVTGAVVKGGYNKLTGKAGFLDTIKSEVSNLTNLKAQFSTAGGIFDPARYSGAAAAIPSAGAQAAPVSTQPLPPIQGPPTAAESALIGEPTFMQQATTAAENIDLTKSFPQLDAPLDPSLGNLQTDSVLDLLDTQAPIGTTATSSLPQAVQDAISTQPMYDELGNQFIGGELVPKGSMIAPDGTLVELAAQPASPPTLRPMPRPDIAASSPQFVGPSAEQLAAEYAPKFTPVEDLIKTQIPTDAQFLAGQGATQSAAESAATSKLANVVDQIKPPGFFESVKGALTPGDDVGFVEGLQTAFAPGSTLPKPSALQDKFGLTLDQAKQAVADATPGMIRTYGPTLAASGLAAQQAGFFKAPEVEEMTIEELQASQGPTGADLIDANPDLYRVDDLRIRGAEGPFRAGTYYAYDPQYGLYAVDPFGQRSQAQRMESGGAAFPRRTGGIDPSEGVPNQDSVRAMLMPGEFVMTTKAVRGMSPNGDSREGIKNMYSMMRNLESRERKMG